MPLPASSTPRRTPSQPPAHHRALAALWLGAGIACATAAGLAWSQAVPGAPAAREAVAVNEGPTWQSLSVAQREALAPLAPDWPRMDSPQKQKWIELAQRMPSMRDDERDRIKARMLEWARMTPAERGQARLRYLQARRATPAADREARWEDYKALPSDQKKQLAARAAPTSASASANRKAQADKVAKATTVKSNLVPNPNFAAQPRSVAPTVIQARPGATTTLVSNRPAPPPHQQTGLPKIAATPMFIDKYTLLPKRGPQGAATVAVGASAAAPAPMPRP